MKPVRVVLDIAARCRDCPEEVLHTVRLVVDEKDVEAATKGTRIIPCPKHRHTGERKKPAEAG